MNVDPTEGLSFLFQFTAANTSPNFLDRANSLNDVLHRSEQSVPQLVLVRK